MGSSAAFCHRWRRWRQGDECTWVYANTTWSHIQTHVVTLMRSHAYTCSYKHMCPTLGALTTTKHRDAKYFSPCFPLREFAVSVRRKQRASVHTHLHTHTAASQKYTRLPDNEGGQGGIITSHHNNIILLTIPAASSVTVWHFHFTGV